MKAVFSLLFALSGCLLVSWLLADHTVAHPQTQPDSLALLTIPTDLVAAGGYSVTVPVVFQNGANAVGSIVFSLDFDQGCLAFDAQDRNNDGMPDAVRFMAPPAFRSTASYRESDTNGEIDIVIADYSLPIASLPDRDPLLTVAFTARCIPAPGAVITAPVRFSTAPVASFGDVTGTDVVGSTSDGFVTIQFDALADTATPTPFPTTTPTSTPTPASGAPTMTPTATPTDTITPAKAHLAVADQQASPGAKATLIVTLNTGGHQIAAATFALALDPAVLHFDTTDADEDGVPDAITLNTPASMLKSVNWNPEAKLLEVALFGMSLPLPTLTDGPLAAITVTVAADTTAHTIPLVLALVSLGDPDGNDVLVTTTEGTLTINKTSTAPHQLYLPLITKGGA